MDTSKLMTSSLITESMYDLGYRWDYGTQKGLIGLSI